MIQPHPSIRLPCYDFTPIICPTFGGWLLKGYLTDFGCYKLRGVTGGVYKARERIHRGMLIRGLLAIPASRSRVADCDPN